MSLNGTMSNKPIAIHQFSPSLGYGDAISNHAINLMKLFRAWGYTSEIYVGHSDRRVSRYCKPYRAYDHRDNNVLIYHYGSASELTRFLVNWPERLVLLYHNITPHHFFEFENTQVYQHLQQARADIKSLSLMSSYAVGVSDYNSQELRALGFEKVRTVPYLLDLSNLDGLSDRTKERQILDALNDDYVNILFIGRIVPNKRDDDLVRLLAYYQHLITPRARLLLVGSASPKYKVLLEILAQELGVANDVHFAGHLELKDGFTAYYKAASVYVSMSEHEGFGVPLLESMHFDVPVIAYAAAAVPETMGDAGILVMEKRYELISELINLVVTDPSLHQKIIYKQRERLKHFERPRLERCIRDWLDDLQETFGR